MRCNEWVVPHQFSSSCDFYSAIMDRRTFLTTLASVGTVASLSGCAGIREFLAGGEQTNEDGITPTEPQPGPDTFRVDFVDENGALGHVGEGYSTEHEYDNAVNQFTDERWDEFDDNDISLGAPVDGPTVESKIDGIQPFVEYALGQRDDIPGYNPGEVTGSWGKINDQRVQDITIDDIRESDKHWAHKLAWGTGFGVQNEIPEVSSGFESAMTVLPAMEYFTEELLQDSKELYTMHTLSREPQQPTDEMIHSAGLTTYRTNPDQNLAVKHIEPTLGGGLPPWFNHAIGDPDESVYEEDREDTAWAPGYRKARRLSNEGKINSESDQRPIGLLSAAVTSTLEAFVDTATMAYEVEIEGRQIPIDEDWNEIRGAFGGSAEPNYVTPEFGRSFEDAFNQYDQDVQEKFEYLGRGILAFYREFDQGEPFAIGGTVDDPEFYKMGIDDLQDAMETQTNDLSQYT